AYPKPVKRWIIGQCQKGFTNEIIFNNVWWKKYATHRDKMLTMAHEIYHCVCELEHYDEVREDGCPVNYMHSSSATPWCVSQYYDEYYKQIQRGCDLNGK